MGNELNAIHRYTDLPGLLHLLQQRGLTLLDPTTWDDSNDSHFLKVYKKKMGLSCLCALCFSDADETYHHWRVFAGGASGVRITFLRDPLLQLCSKKLGVSHRKVQTRKPHLDELPFLKRYPYQHEDEYRVIFESAIEPQHPVSIGLPPSLIRRITLSPWINQSVAEAVKKALQCIPSCQKLRIGRSTLIGNEDWKAFGDRAV